MTAMATVPKSLAEAVEEMHAKLAAYETAVRQSTRAGQRWAEHDALSSRMRIAAADRLVKAGMTKTDAQRDARLDPEYAAHGDKLTQLGNEKVALEGDVNTAKARLEVAIATVKAFAFGYGEIGS